MKPDPTLYPELSPEELPDLSDDADRADYLARICAQWDFYGWPPDQEVVEALKSWKHVFEQHPLPRSPAFRALCWELKIPAPPAERYLGELRWEVLDEREGRPYDVNLYYI